MTTQTPEDRGMGGEKHTPAWEGDSQFQESTVREASGDTVRGWSITKDDGWSFWVPVDSPVEPKPGTRVRMYGRGIGSRVRGLFLDGQCVFYRTEAEDAEYFANELYGKDAADVLARWDAGRGIWSIAMGGFGPGYEQALQMAAIEALRHLDGGGDIETVEPPIYLGLSGAQWGAARGLAVAFHTKGPRGLLEMYGNDRHIQVSRDFPVAPDPLRDAAPDLLEALKELRRVGNDMAARKSARAKADAAIAKAQGPRP